MQSIFCGSLKTCLLQNWLPTARIDASVFLNTQLGLRVAPSVKDLSTPDLIQKKPRLTQNESRQAPSDFIGRLSRLGDVLGTASKLQWKTAGRFRLILWNFDQGPGLKI